MAKHADPHASAGPSVHGAIRNARAVVGVVLAGLVLGGGAGLLLTDDAPSSAAVLAEPAFGAPSAQPATSKDPAVVERSDPRPAPPSPAPGDPDWDAELSRIDAARSEAFARGDPTILETVYADQSGPLELDSAALSALTEAGVRAVGLRVVADDVSVVQIDGNGVVLRVVDHMPAYELVRADGSAVEHRAGRGAAAWTVTLTSVDGGWRIAEIIADPSFP